MAVDLPWGDPRTATFSTSVGLITSNGPHGPTIMACEWTHQLSYSPGIIGVAIGLGKATGENIAATKEFGVNIAVADQNVLSSVAGRNSGKKVDKIKALEELGFKFFKVKKIRAPMVEGAAMQAECRLIEQKTYGDHIFFVGEIVELYPATDKQPLVYHNTKYSKPGEIIPKPDQKKLDQIDAILKKYAKKQ